MIICWSAQDKRVFSPQVFIVDPKLRCGGEILCYAENSGVLPTLSYRQSVYAVGSDSSLAFDIRGDSVEAGNVCREC